jgi:hypothetical protein
MALRLSTSSQNIRGLKRDSNAKFAAPPHRCGTVMVGQAGKRNNWKLGRTHKEIHKQLQVNIQAARINRKSQSLHTSAQQNTSIVHTKMEHYKNSAVNVSDERAIDAFTLGLRQGYLVNEMGRIKPRTVSDLMDIANRFVDGKTLVTIKGRGHPKTTEETNTSVKGGDPTTMIIMVLIVK